MHFFLGLDALAQVQKKKMKAPPPLAMTALNEALNSISNVSNASVPRTNNAPAHPLLLQARSENSRKIAL
jgi:hypothetical protein